MPTLTVSRKGQVTLRRDILAHIGVRPGERIDVDFLPDAVARISAAREDATWADSLGLLEGRTDRAMSIEEINETISAGWAGELR